MTEAKLIDNIRSHGTYKDTDEGRLKVIEDVGLRIGQKAKHVIITGCNPPEEMPHVLRALKELLEYLQIDYTLLSKEFCCGWTPLRQPALIAKNVRGMVKAAELARESIMKNFRQAEALGAESIVPFCAACEPSYTHYAKATNLEVISYTALLDRYFSGAELNMEADYYAGCYRFRRRITPEPVDIESAVRVLKKIKGLRVHHLNSKLCWYIQRQLELLLGSLTTRTMITICTGCYNSLRNKVPETENLQIKMLPEVLLEAIRGGKLQTRNWLTRRKKSALRFSNH